MTLPVVQSDALLNTDNGYGQVVIARRTAPLYMSGGSIYNGWPPPRDSWPSAGTPVVVTVQTGWTLDVNGTVYVAGNTPTISSNLVKGFTDIGAVV